jgi:hypothetical protein
VDCPSTEKLVAEQFANCTGDKRLTYGSGELNGTICTTTVSTEGEAEKFVKNMRIVKVTSASLPNIVNTEWDGIVGLLPTATGGSQLLVEQMKQQGMIEKAVFSIRYLDSKYGSEITFGGFDDDIVPQLENFTFTELFDHNYWSVGLRGMRYGTTDLKIHAQRGILDTGSSLLVLPEPDYNSWFAAISEGRNCGDYGSYKGCYCDSYSDFEDIYITFGDYEYRIVSNQYVEEITSNDKNFCYFLVGKLGNFPIPTAILGDTFIRNYYIYHDMEEMRVGLYGEYMENVAPANKRWIYFGISGVVILVVIISFSLYYYTKDREDKAKLSKRYRAILENSQISKGPLNRSE